VHDQPLFLRTLSRFAEVLPARYDLEVVFTDLTESAIAVLGLCGSRVTMAEDGNRVCAAQRGILMLREVSGGGLAHPGYTPSTSGSRPSRGVSRALSSANVRNRMVVTVRAVGERDMIGIPTDRDSHLLTEALTAIKVTAWAVRRTRLSGQEWPGGSAELVAIRSVDRG